MDKIRIFAAVSPGVIPSLTRWLEELKKYHANDRLKWADSSQWHITLRFVGDILHSEFPALSERLALALEDAKAGSIVVEGSGFFGPPPRPKVLWAGIRESEWLNDLQRRTAEACSGFGFSGKTGSFHPHLTLARINFLEDPSLLIKELKQKKDVVWCEKEIEQVILFRSQLTKRGPVYSVLKQFILG